MKQYLLISNTTENKINNSILNYLSQKLEYSTFKETNFRELSLDKNLFCRSKRTKNNI